MKYLFYPVNIYQNPSFFPVIVIRNNIADDLYDQTIDVAKNKNSRPEYNLKQSF